MSIAEKIAELEKKFEKSGLSTFEHAKAFLDEARHMNETYVETNSEYADEASDLLNTTLDRWLDMLKKEGF